MTRMHRVLMQVVSADRRAMWVTIPSWRDDEPVEVDLGAMPEALRPMVQTGAYFLAMANLGANNPLDLNLHMFEYVEPPSDDSL